MTLRTRLAILIALAIVTAVLAQSILGFLEFQRVLYKDLDGDLNQFLGMVTVRIQSFDDFKNIDTNYENYVTRARILDGDKVRSTVGGSFPKANGIISTIPISNLGWRFAGLLLPGLGPNVRLEAAINSQEYDKSLVNYRTTAFLSAIVFSSLGVLSALFLSGQALRPLEDLLGTISEIAASGNLTLRVTGVGHRELVRLGDGFNRMLERLQAYRVRETEFTRHASHELRTPLTAIGLEVGLYREGIITAEEAVNTIEIEAQRMKRLSEALLLLAREGKPDMQWFDLGQLGKACAQRFNAKFLGFSEVEFYGNAVLIERALENLLENALKHAPGSTIEVRLELERQQGYAMISVTDNGSGLNREARQHATDLYFRASIVAGHGIGLSIVKRILEVHGGQVLVENAKPQGLRVSLAFPLEVRQNH